MASYDIGDVVRVTGTFTDADGVATDPTTVTGKYKDPSDNETTDSSPTNSATGVYYFDIEIDEAGSWKYRLEGKTVTPSNQGAAEGSFQVNASNF